MQSQLSSFGVASNSAISGEKAIEILRERLLIAERPHFKLILLDFNMPGMSGPETAKEIRRMVDEFREEKMQPNYPDPFICCLTANTGKTFRDEAIDAGMDDFMQKPLYLENLKTLLVKTKISNIK